MDAAPPSLAQELAAALPKGCPFTLHHISTPPTKCEPIYAPPPGAKPERTYRESHFLNVSITPGDATDSSEIVAVMAVECLIYTTKRLTTIFVSKADSTGYLPILRDWLPKGAPSPLRTIATTFIAFLVKHRIRRGITLVVNLFARASNQYLYPGSVENPAKHVSDDRQLVRWWIRVLHPILSAYTPFRAEEPLEMAARTVAQAFLRIPGADSVYSFFPDAVRHDPAQRARWSPQQPVSELGLKLWYPPRCLVPRFPDDPKHRFLVELDNELPDAPAGGAAAGGAAAAAGEGAGGGGGGSAGGSDVAMEDTPTAAQAAAQSSAGRWRSVQTLEEFWDLMAYRAECSAGRCVGFMWIVFDKPEEGELVVDPSAEYLEEEENPVKEPNRSIEDAAAWKATAGNSQKPPKRRKKPTGPIVARLPRIKSTTQVLKSKFPEHTQYFFWPMGTRGGLVLEDKDYSKAVEILLDLDFADRHVATQSTKTWVDQVKVLGGLHSAWGERITGMMIYHVAEATNGASKGAMTVNVLGVKRKKAHSVTAPNVEDIKRVKAEPSEAGQVNVLGAGLVRKKPKKITPTQVSTT